MESQQYFSFDQNIRKPNLFVVGSWKAGTTSLYHYLNSHPEIFMSPVKEPHHFSTDISFVPKIFQSSSDYSKLFKNAKNQNYVGEASTSYLVSNRFVEEAQHFNPHSKIIVMLRDPLETLYGLHYEMKVQAQTEKSFEEELQNQAIGRASVNSVELYKKIPSHIRLLRKSFGADNVYLGDFKNFTKDTRSEYQSILSFLNVDTTVLPKHFIAYNQSTLPRSRTLSRLFYSSLMQKIGKIAYSSTPFESKLESLRRTVLRKTQNRPPMRAEIARQLKKELKPTIDELQILLDEN